jgi:hypothetical protein
VSLVFPAAILYQWQLVVLPSCARSSTPNIPPPHQQLAFAGTKKVALSPSFILSATITPWSPIPDPDQVLSIGSSVGRQPRTDLADRGPGPFKHYGRPRCHCTSCPTRVNCSSAISVVIGPLAPYVCIAWGVGDKKVALVSGLAGRQPVTIRDIGAAVTGLLESTHTYLEQSEEQLWWPVIGKLGRSPRGVSFSSRYFTYNLSASVQHGPEQYNRLEDGSYTNCPETAQAGARYPSG